MFFHLDLDMKAIVEKVVKGLVVFTRGILSFMRLLVMVIIIQVVDILILRFGSFGIEV